jgi:hypothetical protein
MATETNPAAAHLVIITVEHSLTEYGADADTVVGLQEVPCANVEDAWADADDVIFEMWMKSGGERSRLSFYVEGVTAPCGTWSQPPASAVPVLASYNLAA